MTYLFSLAIYFPYLIFIFLNYPTFFGWCSFEEFKNKPLKGKIGNLLSLTILLCLITTTHPFVLLPLLGIFLTLSYFRRHILPYIKIIYTFISFSLIILFSWIHYNPYYLLLLLPLGIFWRQWIKHFDYGYIGLMLILFISHIVLCFPIQHSIGPEFMLLAIMFTFAIGSSHYKANPNKPLTIGYTIPMIIMVAFVAMLASQLLWFALSLYQGHYLPIPFKEDSKNTNEYSKEHFQKTHEKKILEG